MRKLTIYLVSAFAAILFSMTRVQPAAATMLTNGDYTFQSLNPAPTGTGFGSYDIILFENSSGGAGNSGDGVNVDNSNGNLPTGSTSDSGSLFWLTSIGDLRAFYDLQFNGSVTNIVVFLDVNETGQPQDLTLNTLTIYKNSTTTPNLDPTGSNDLTSAQEQSITGLTGGTLLSQLASSLTLAQVATGNGSDDWAIFTGINPYDPTFNVTDTLLFNFRISSLNNGPETLIISGSISNCDFPGQKCDPTTAQVPEPSTLLLLGSGLVAIARTRRRKRA